MARSFGINTEELNDEVPMTLHELRSLVTRVELAAKRARPNQVFRTKISADICLVFRDVATMTDTPPVIGSKFESTDVPTPAHRGLNS
jgi:hypothetical protein